MAPVMVYTLRYTPMLLQFLSYLGTGPANSAVEGRAVSSRCGRQVVRGSRIVNGDDAFHGEFPWMVSIRYRNQHLCGGALIANRWVLTASHCLYGVRNKTSRFTVVVGDHRQDSPEEPDAAEVLPIDKIVTHPEFRTRNYLNDVALIRLRHPVEWDEFKQPICLPDPDDDLHIGQEAIVTGWGWLNEAKNGGTKANTLQKLSVKVLDNRECTIWYREANYPFTFQPTQLCAGYKEGGKDSCEGDSGGPLIHRSPEDDFHKLIGIVSSGVGCARPLLPGLYTRVAPFVPWIQEQIQ